MYAIRDAEGKFVAHAQSKAAAHRWSRRANMVGGSIESSPPYTLQRLVPARLLSIHSRGERLVASIRVHPPGAHPPGTPIKSDLYAVEAVLDDGNKRWFGTSGAWITSELRMAMFVNPRDEVLRNWEKVPREDQQLVHRQR